MIKELKGEDLLYGEFAKYYDLLYSKAIDHRKAASTVKSLIRRYKRSGGIELLDVGCGTGKDLLYLKDRFRCTGLDVSDAMLKVARKDVKGVKLLKADMQTFRLGRKFDVIISLGSVIGYAKTYANLEKVIRRISMHLKPGGVTVIEPWIEKKDFAPGYTSIDTYDSKDLKIARLAYSRVKGDTSIVEFGFLIAEKSKGMRYISDRAVDGLFEDSKMVAMMRRNGIDAKIINGIKGAYRSRYIVGVKR